MLWVTHTYSPAMRSELMDMWKDALASSGHTRAPPPASPMSSTSRAVEFEGRLGVPSWSGARAAGVERRTYVAIRDYLVAQGWHCVNRESYWDTTFHSAVLDAPARAKMTMELRTAQCVTKESIGSVTHSHGAALCRYSASVEIDWTLHDGVFAEATNAALRVCTGEDAGWVRLKRRETFAEGGVDGPGRTCVDLTVVRQGKSIRDAATSTPVYEVEVECMNPRCEADIDSVVAWCDRLSGFVAASPN